MAGGSEVVAFADLFFNSKTLFAAATGTPVALWVGYPIAGLPDKILRYYGETIYASAMAERYKKDRKGETVKVKYLKTMWSIRGIKGGVSLIAAGNTVISGGENTVSVALIGSKKAAWSSHLDGTPYGLAVADGRLYVSTDKGLIYCFAGERAGPAAVIGSKTEESPRGHNTVYAAAAKEIIERTGISEGYCLDLACGDGALAHELAKRTKLHIYAVDSDPQNVATARERLDAAGVYGVRVTVHRADPANTPYPNYFADLIVSGRSVTQGPADAASKEVSRILRPNGGTACIGKAGSVRTTVRGGLPGAGSWTHQYCDPANTCSSTDTRLKGPLGMLWFKDLGLRMSQRHGRGPAPLYSDGRLFIEGLHAMLAVDAYNGRRLWEFPLKGILAAYDQDHLVGTAATGSNYCLGDGSVYVRVESRCIRIDAASGKKLAEFKAPKQPNGRPGIWGYIACANGTLFGSLATKEHVVAPTYVKSRMSELLSESGSLFAMDATTGKLKWTYRARQSIRHNAVAIGSGRIYLIDRPAAAVDRIQKDRRRNKPRPRHPTGELVALDAATGKVVWTTSENIYGTMLALSVKHNVLLMSYQPSGYYTLPSERGGRMAGFRASDGKRLWDTPSHYVTRPLINGRTIYAQGGAWDLLTGKKKQFTFKRSYGCGILSGSTNFLFFRSGVLGYVDLLKDEGTENYGGIRPGCWINAIGAGGLVLMPDATDGCECSYLNKASIALQPMQ